MKNIMKRDNGRQPATFGSVVDQIFQNNLSRFFDDDVWGINPLNQSSVPVNIRETETGYSIEVVAPGLKKQDFQLNISGNNLVISFRHTEENKNDHQQAGWIKQEYKKQEFSRSFYLDETIDAGKIAARYEDGILKLELPRKEQSQNPARTIDIQ